MTFKGWIAASAIAVLLAGCTGLAAIRPIVDMEGVDPVKLNRDMAACEDYVASQLISAGNGVSRCMSEKGYKILRWN